MNVSSLSPLSNKEIDSNHISLETFRNENLIVAPSHPVFTAAKVLCLGYNPLFVGRPGCSKTVSSEALLCAGNYHKLLNGTRLANVNVEINWVQIDMIPIVTSSELSYEHKQDSSGIWSKMLTGLDQFIQRHGFLDRGEFEAAEAERQRVLLAGEGVVRLFVAYIDDFDRVSDPALLNSFLRQVEEHRHELANGEVRWFNLQCIGTSNSSIGRQGNQCLGSLGLDRAVADRFILLSPPAFDPEPVLNREFPGNEIFIRRLSQLTADVCKSVSEGEFDGLGEIGMRSLRPAVKCHVIAGMSQDEAAMLLFSGLTDEQSSIKAQNLVAQYFGRNTSKPRVFRSR